MLLTHMSNLVTIRCYLLFDQYAYFLCILLDYKKLKFKHLVDDITIDFLSFGNFASMKNIKRKYIPMMDLLKFTFNKKILSKVVAGVNL